MVTCPEPGKNAEEVEEARLYFEHNSTDEEAEGPHGWAQPTYDVRAPPGVTSLAVRDEFLEPGTVYEIEVLAIEVSGNQTISTIFFTTP